MTKFVCSVEMRRVLKCECAYEFDCCEENRFM